MLAEQAWCQFREVLISQKTGMLYLPINEKVCNTGGIVKTHWLFALKFRTPNGRWEVGQ